jgi:hypothetical protein
MGNRACVRRVEREVRLHRLRAIDEQAHRVALGDRGQVRRLVRHTKGRDAEHALTGDVETLPTRRQHPHAGTALDHLTDETRHRA